MLIRFSLNMLTKMKTTVEDSPGIWFRRGKIPGMLGFYSFLGWGEESVNCLEPATRSVFFVASEDSPRGNSVIMACL